MENHPLHDSFVKAFNAGDLDAIVALYDDDCVFAAQPGQYVRGKAAIRSAITPFLQPGIRMEFKTVFVIENGELALMSGDWTLTGGPEPINGRTSEVARRGADGVWRYYLDTPWGA